MIIHHSDLMNEFISFWFETRVDGDVKYETHVDFLNGEWSTWEYDRLGEEGAMLVSGELAPGLPDTDKVQAVIPVVTDAIRRAIRDLASP